MPNPSGLNDLAIFILTKTVKNCVKKLKTVNTEKFLSKMFLGIILFHTLIISVDHFLNPTFSLFSRIYIFLSMGSLEEIVLASVKLHLVMKRAKTVAAMYPESMREYPAIADGSNDKKYAFG